MQFMKKQKRLILLLSVAMAFIFAGLLIVQMKYINDTVKLRDHQFSESVKRSLKDIMDNLESSEAERYLNIFMLEEQKSRQQALQDAGKDLQELASRYISGISDKRLVTNDQNRQIYIAGISDKMTVPAIPESTTNKLQNKLQTEYYHQRKQLENVAIKWLKETSELPIQERIDFDELDIFIHAALENNGINIPYHFSIAQLNKNGKWVDIYRCSDFEKTKDQAVVFDQKLFPNEHTSKDNYLRLYFPTEKDYIMGSMTMLLPSIMLTSLLLIIFTVTLLVIFRQKRLDEIKNDFVSNMTHEFKTPISTISLASQMLQDQGMTKTPEAIKSIANIIKSETGRLSFLVERILLMSIEHTSSTLKMAEVNINDLITHCVATFSLKVENKGGEIISELNAENPWAMVDETHFTNVIFNLMDNAVKYNKEEEPLLLTVKTWNDDKGFLFISIQDNGIGIKKESLNKIFEKFYRVPTGNVHNVKGFGLGLAYVKKIVDGHKGFIKAESELNQGTKFIIKIPTLKKIE